MTSQAQAEATFQKLQAHGRETAILESVKDLLEWDERTLMPHDAGEYRAEQVTYLSGVVHRRRTDPQIGEWLGELATSPLARDRHGDAATTIRELRRDFERRTKLPPRLVEELARLSILGQQQWVESRANNDFASFRPMLEQIVALKREQAAAIGFQEHPYDALLDEFEPDARTSEVTRVLEGLRVALVPLIERIAASSRRPNLEILRRHYPRADQEEFGTRAARSIGFCFRRGRLDVTQHPFCTTTGPKDCRITTRYDEKFFPGAFFGILHEAGHGVYEQGLRHTLFGLPPGSAISLGIHESQSRMWENLVGRSHAFWQHFFPLAQQAFPQALGDVKLDDFHFAINDVRPSLIRVEADEATYNLHIIIRFELEQALITGDLAVADLPGAWSEKYTRYLGIASPTDAKGVLQDVHWSAALIGYFPTYALGNLHAAQLFAAAERAIGPLDAQFARGEFAPLHAWLSENVYQRGRCYTAAELIEHITGSSLSHQPLIAYLQRKFTSLYGDVGRGA